MEIERLYAEENGPIFATQNGYGRLLVMDMDYYERTMRKIDEANLINEEIADYEAGKVVDGKGDQL